MLIKNPDPLSCATMSAQVARETHRENTAYFILRLEFLRLRYVRLSGTGGAWLD